MARFDITNTLKKVASYIGATGRFGKVVIGEPKAAPSASLAASIWMDSVNLVKLFANGGTREQHIVTIRVYKPLFKEPEEKIELETASAVSDLMADMLNDYDLGSNGIMTIDAAGMEGQAIAIQWGHVDISGTLFRVADITLPMIVDDSATMSA